MSKWTGVTEFGDETMTNATRLRILALLGPHTRLELVESGVHQFSKTGVVVGVEQRDPRIGRTQTSNDVSRLVQGTSGRSSMRRQQRLTGNVADDGLTRKPISQICDCRQA